MIEFREAILIVAILIVGYWIKEGEKDA